MGAIKEKIDYLIKKHGTNNPFEIAGALNITIIYEPLGSILGYFSKSLRIKVIHINESATEKEQLFTCAHELGHAVLHPDVNTPFLKSYTYFPTEKIEREANMFAIKLLYSQETVNPISIHDATEQYGIPKQLLIKNFHL